MTPPSREDVETLAQESRWVGELARRLVGDVHLAEDVAQESFVRAIGAQSTAHSLRAVLSKIVGKVAAGTRRREHVRRMRERERANAGPDPEQPSTFDIVARVEQQKILVDAVLELDEPYRRTVLQRYFEGTPQREIAQREDIPTTTVNSRLTRAIAKLRQGLDGSHGGDRRRWVTALTPLLPNLGRVLAHGAWIMSSKSKIVGLVAVMLIAAALFVPFSFGWSEDSTANDDQSGSTTTEVVATGEPSVARRDPPTIEKPEARTQIQPEPTSNTGHLVVGARFGSNGAPAAGVWILVAQPGQLTEALRQCADAAGVARFANLAARSWSISSDRGFGHATVKIQAHGETVVDVELPVGMTIRGTVVDGKTDMPVVGAAIEMTRFEDLRTPHVVAHSGSDGRFTLRDAPTRCAVAARANGFASGNRVRFGGRKNSSVEVRLVLRDSGGVVEGSVRDPGGEPVVHALVRVGAWQRTRWRKEGPPLLAFARTGDDGCFRMFGVAVGRQPIAVLAPDFEPWRGECEVSANRPTSLRISLVAGCRVRGRVLDTQGEPKESVQVRIGRGDPLTRRQVGTDVAGRFELRGLTAGEAEIRAVKYLAGKVSRRIRLRPEAVASCELQLSRGVVLSGRVVDEDGRPAAGVSVQCWEETESVRPWIAGPLVDAEGRFTIDDCPTRSLITVEVAKYSPGFEPTVRKHIDPKAGELEIVLRKSPPATIRIEGRVLDAAGRALANIRVQAYAHGFGGGADALTGADGRFSLGPVRPGRFNLRIRTKSHAEYSVLDRQLLPDTTWQLGDIRLRAGGEGIVRLRGIADPQKSRFSVRLAGRSVNGSEFRDGAWRTRMLAPGDYEFCVFGDGFAAQGGRFTIREGAVTAIELNLRPGVRVPIELTVPSIEQTRYAHLLLRCNGQRVLEKSVFRTSGRRHATTVHLAPGTYSLRARATGFEGAMQLEVKAGSSNAPVR